MRDTQNKIIIDVYDVDKVDDVYDTDNDSTHLLLLPLGVYPGGGGLEEAPPGLLEGGGPAPPGHLLLSGRPAHLELQATLGEVEEERGGEGGAQDA